MKRDVLVVLYDGVQGVSFAGPMEALSAGSATTAGDPGPVYEIRTASLGGAPVRTSSGLTVVPDGALEDASPAHTLVIPGSDQLPLPTDQLGAALGASARGAGRVAAVSTGVFLLAETGALRGRRATTHWQWCDLLAERHPDVDVDKAATVVRDGRVTTSGGGTSGIDLAVSLVAQDAGQERAVRVSRELVSYRRRPGGQLQFIPWTAPTVEHPVLRSTLRWISDNLGEDLSGRSLAERAGISPRHINRLFASHTGMSPRQYVESARVGAARRMMERTGQPDRLEEIAKEAGFSTLESMRVSFRRVLQVAPGEYRERFGAPYAPE
ncbi:GlxA family transcriptional regulator [Streptomyces sp. NPDC057302]|uniref:GlxA family transcriptional regulator n=1 Tax=Streptomyces sp. NPDC057302 TaxID=3346094 RepID=UPI003637BB9B